MRRICFGLCLLAVLATGCRPYREVAYSRPTTREARVYASSRGDCTAPGNSGFWVWRQFCAEIDRRDARFIVNDTIWIDSPIYPDRIIWQPGQIGENLTYTFDRPFRVDHIYLWGQLPQPWMAVEVFVDSISWGTFRCAEKIALRQSIQILQLRVVTHRPPAQHANATTNETVFHVHYADDTKGMEVAPSFFGPDGKAIGVAVPRTVEGRVLASSVEEPSSGYHPSHLFDNRLDLGWSDSHHGVDESVAISLDDSIRVEKIRIWNGIEGNESLYRATTRAKRIQFSAGGEGPDYLLPDAPGPVEIVLETPLRSSQFLLKVMEVYPSAANGPVALAELQFNDGDHWFGLHADGQQLLEEFVDMRTRGTLVNGMVLDQYLGEWRSTPADSSDLPQKGLVLRRNGTFGMDVAQAGQRYIGEGVWEVHSLGEKEAHLRLTGNMTRVRAKGAAPAGEIEPPLPFQEDIYLSRHMLRGGPWLGTLSWED